MTDKFETIEIVCKKEYLDPYLEYKKNNPRKFTKEKEFVIEAAKHLHDYYSGRKE